MLGARCVGNLHRSARVVSHSASAQVGRAVKQEDRTDVVLPAQRLFLLGHDGPSTPSTQPTSHWDSKPALPPACAISGDLMGQRDALHPSIPDSAPPRCPGTQASLPPGLQSCPWFPSAQSPVLQLLFHPGNHLRAWKEVPFSLLHRVGSCCL